MHLLLDAKLLFLVAFLLLVIVSNLIKSYRIHKPRNEPFSMAEFVIYSKNRTSEFFGVTKNVYIAFCILAGFFTIVSVNAFMDRSGDAVDVAKTVAEDGLDVVDDGFQAVKEQQAEMKTQMRVIEERSNTILDKLEHLPDTRTRQNTAQPSNSPPPTVEDIEEAPMKIVPSSQLSGDDEIIKTEDESLYATERKRATIRPSSE